jgi:uncharacterized protein YfbU (UPF0304 family)
MKLSDGERLILIMLSEIHERLEIKNGVDTKLVKSAIYDGNLWALKRELSGIFHDYEAPDEIVKETTDILDMWRFIETSYERLSPSDKARIKKEAEPFGEHVRFSGFDGNNESEYIGVARCYVDELDSFSLFKGRDFNSHVPLVAAYRRMYALFEPMRSSEDLTAPQIIEILKAMPYPKAQKATGYN